MQARVLCLIYMHNIRGHATPKGECIYIRQSMSVCVITNILHFRHSQICPNLVTTEQPLYIVTDTDYDCRNLFVTFPPHF